MHRWGPSRTAVTSWAAVLVLGGGLALGAAGCSSGSAQTGADPTSPASQRPPASDSPDRGPSPSSVSSAPSPSGPAADSGPTADDVITISVKGRTVTPAPGRRKLSVGDRVHLVVTTDRANVLHVHGVDIERDLAAGVPLTLDFTVKDPGVYPVELHEPELLLTQLVVR